MKKTNLLLQAAVASTLVLSFAAQASIGVTNRNFAVEQFLGSTPAATTISLAPISYQFSGPVAAASTFYIYVALSGGATFTAAPAVTTLTGNTADGSVVDSTGPAGGTVTAVALAADSTYARFTVVLAAGKALSSISVFSFTPAVATVTTANGALATLGGTITANWVNNTTATTGTLPAGDIDTSGTHTGIVATSTQGIALTAASSGAFPFNSSGLAETAKINVASTPTNSKFITNANAGSTTVINLGALRATNGTAVIGSTGAAYTIASQVASLSYTVTAPAGFFAALGTTGTFRLNDAASCSGTNLATSTSTAFASAAAAAAATSVVVTGAAVPTTATNYYVCMTVNGTTAMIAGTPVLTASLVHTTTTTDSNETLAATNLYPLALNGSQVDVRTYIPAGAAGYTSFVRVINTGVIAAQVNAASLSEAGVAGTPGILIASLPAGGAQTLTSAQVEAATGAIAPTTTRPRIRITALTNGLQVQSFILTNANGNFSDVTGSQGVVAEPL